ncbi:MAG: hypothetical protein ACM3O6_11925 [Acidobacteriota bacterium]
MRVAYETTLARAGAGILVGTVTGTLLVSLVIAGSAVLASYAHWSSSVDFSSGNLFWLLFIVVAIFGTFGIGLLALAAPIWWLLHRCGRRSWIDAMALGAVLTFATCAAPSAIRSVWPPQSYRYSSSDGGGPEVIDNKLTEHGWHNLLKTAGLFSAAGSIVGLVIWRVAYRRHHAAQPA